MLKVVVYGNNKWSHLLKECIEKEYSKALKENNGESVVVSSFFSEKSGENEIDFKTAANLYHKGEINAFVIPKEYYIQYNDIMQTLIKLQIDISDIYNGIRLSEKIHDILNRNTNLIPSIITPMLNDSYLSYLEYHVADHCNLNCKFCTHYSPLVKEPVFTNLENFKEDLLRLKNYIDDIGVIRILGGEPLLNPELPQFVEYTRRLYPNSIITVVTNGLIVDRISNELINVMKEKIAFFHISYYPALENKIDVIKKFLLEKEIGFTVSPRNDKFLKTQTLTENPDEDFFYSCFQATCTCIHDGKIAPCYAPFTTKYFNEAFDKNLPTDEGIDLYSEENTTENIKLKLLYPMERCKYCYKGTPYNWEIIGKNSVLNDWVD